MSKKPRLDQSPAANLDADDPLTDEEDEDEDFEEESDDDDTAALLAELEKIKKERASEFPLGIFSNKHNGWGGVGTQYLLVELTRLQISYFIGSLCARSPLSPAPFGWRPTDSSHSVR